MQRGKVGQTIILDTVIAIFGGIGRRRGRRDANSLFLSRNLGHAAATVSCFRCYRLLRTYVPYIHQKRCHDIDRKSLFHSFNSLHLENIAFFSLGFINPIPQNTFLYCKREKLDTSLETNFHANVPFQIFIFFQATFFFFD